MGSPAGRGAVPVVGRGPQDRLDAARWAPQVHGPVRKPQGTPTHRGAGPPCRPDLTGGLPGNGAEGQGLAQTGRQNPTGENHQEGPQPSQESFQDRSHHAKTTIHAGDARGVEPLRSFPGPRLTLARAQRSDGRSLSGLALHAPQGPPNGGSASGRTTCRKAFWRRIPENPVATCGQPGGHASPPHRAPGPSGCPRRRGSAPVPGPHRGTARTRDRRPPCARGNHGRVHPHLARAVPGPFGPPTCRRAASLHRGEGWWWPPCRAGPPSGSGRSRERRPRALEPDHGPNPAARNWRRSPAGSRADEGTSARLSVAGNGAIPEGAWDGLHPGYRPAVGAQGSRDRAASRSCSAVSRSSWSQAGRSGA